MTARNIDKRSDNIVIGAGEVYLDLHEGGASTGERYLGDAVGAALEITTEETTVFSGSGPVARELARIARSVTRTVTLTLHDISLENLALFAVGEMRRLNAAAPVSGEPAVLRPGRWHQLGGADRPAGVLGLPSPADKATAIAAVTVSTTAQTPVTATQEIAAKQFAAGAGETEQKGQYIVDYDRARIYWLPPDHPLYAARGRRRGRLRCRPRLYAGRWRARPGAGCAAAGNRRLSLHRGCSRGPGAKHLRTALFDPTGRRVDPARRSLVRAADPARRLDAGAERRPARALHRRAGCVMDGVEELSVLFPDCDVTVRDPDTREPVTLTVREFRFREGLETTALARPLLAALAALVPAGNGGTDAEVARDARGKEAEGPDALAIEGALAAHVALWLELAARASGRDAAWLARLSDADGRALSEAMWAANGGFFLRRVMAQVATRAKGEKASPLRSTGCSTPSSVPATDAATSTSASA